MAKKEEVSDSASNIQLRWNCKKDQPAIEAIRELAKELNVDGVEALRWICENTKSYAIQKAKQVKELLKAS